MVDKISDALLHLKNKDVQQAKVIRDQDFKTGVRGVVELVDCLTNLPKSNY